MLSIERGEDLKQYQEKIAASTITERQKRGVCWYPLNIIERGFGFGEYPFIVVERVSHDHHVLRPGNTVEVFSNVEGESYDHILGVIQFIDKQRAKLTLQVDSFPDWLRLGKLGFHLYHDERTFNVMQEALETVLNAENDRISELRESFYNDMPVSFNEEGIDLSGSFLNDSQAEAVHKIWNNQDWAIIHGPPGTGKTSTLVEAIPQLVKKEKQVLVCAPSNSATDLLAIRLAEKGCNVLRIGNLSRIDKSILDLTLEGKLKDRKEMKEIKKMKKEAAEYRRLSGKYKRQFGAEEREQRRLLRDQAKEIMKQVRLTEDYLVEMIMGQADAICCTLVGSASKLLQDRHFETVFIDEAAQALEGATWIPILKANKVVLAGDPYQLPPTVKSYDAAKKGMDKTLMERCIPRKEAVVLLDTQYRMNHKIMGFSNDYFYEGKLKSDPQVEYATLKLESMHDTAVEFIDTAGTGYEEKQNPKSRSYYNQDEYQLIGKHLTKLLTALPEENPFSIGIISPYKEQVVYMQEQVREHFAPEHREKITVNTIDAFQGQERDIIYISMVRSNAKNAIGFLKDYRRMNVAMTRAKRKLVIVGDSGTLGNDKFYEQLLEYCEKNEAYFSAWEWM